MRREALPPPMSPAAKGYDEGRRRLRRQHTFSINTFLQKVHRQERKNVRSVDASEKKGWKKRPRGGGEARSLGRSFRLSQRVSPFWVLRTFAAVLEGGREGCSLR